MTTIPMTTTGIANGSANNANNVLTALNDLKTGLEQAIDGGYPFGKVVLANTTLLTISGGVLTVTQSRHRVNNEGGATTDEVDTISISGTNFDLLLLQQGSAGQTTTYRHNTGNLWFEDGRDYILNDQNRILVLWRNATTGKWSSLNRNNGSLWLSTAADATLSSDTLTATQSKLRLIPQTGTADDLTTISNPNNLDMLVLSVKNSGDTITLKHGGTSLYFENQLDLVMGDQNRVVILLRNPTTGKWSGITAYSSAQLGYQDYVGNLGTFNKIEVPYKAFANLGNNKVRLDAMPRFIRRRMFWDEVQQGTTLTQFGLTMTNVGTATAATTADTSYLRLTSAASIGSYASRRSSSQIFQWQWAMAMEAYVANLGIFGNGLDNDPAYIGFMNGGPPSVSAGPSVSYVGVSGVWIKPYNNSGTTWAGQAWFNGSKLGQVLFGTSNAGDRNLFRIWVDDALNRVVFAVNDEVSAPLSITPGGLATTGMDLFVGNAAITAAGYTVDISRIYGEQD